MFNYFKKNKRDIKLNLFCDKDEMHICLICGVCERMKVERGICIGHQSHVKTWALLQLKIKKWFRFVFVKY